ncbi:MAG: SGNH/GDSL hydrolase family protein, partial [Bacteroidota bacterium]
MKFKVMRKVVFFVFGLILAVSSWGQSSNERRQNLSRAIDTIQGSDVAYSKPLIVQSFFSPYAEFSAPNNASTNGNISNTWEFSGTVGNAFILMDTDTVAAFGNALKTFPLVLEWVEGTDTTYENVVSTYRGNDTVYLDAPLTHSCAICRVEALHLEPLEQHLTKFGTRLFVDQFYNRPIQYHSSGEIIEHITTRNSSKFNTFYKVNPASSAYGDQTIDNVRTRINTDNAAGNYFYNIQSGDSRVYKPYQNSTGRIRIGTHAVGQGLTGTTYVKGKRGVSRLYVSANVSNVITPEADSLMAEIIITGDETIIKRDTVYTSMKMIEASFSGYDSLTIDVRSLRGSEWWIDVWETTINTTENYGQRTIPRNSKIVVLGDSWTKFHENEFANYLQSRITRDEGSGVVVNQGLGGRTSAWALDWFDTLVVSEKPDIVILEYFTNDVLAGPLNYTAPDGTTKNYAVGDIDHWKANLIELQRRSVENGIVPIVLNAFPVGSPTQSQIHSTWALELLPSVTNDLEREIPTVVPLALTDETSYINQFGKYAGRLIHIDTALYVATGESPSDSWNLVSGGQGGGGSGVNAGTAGTLPKYDSNGTNLEDSRISESTAGVNINGELIIADITPTAGVATQFIGLNSSNTVTGANLSNDLFFNSGVLSVRQDTTNYLKKRGSQNNLFYPIGGSNASNIAGGLVLGYLDPVATH